MLNLKVVAFASGSGKRFIIGYASTLEMAGTLVQMLDDRFLLWDAAGYPTLDKEDPLNAWEGCDIEAVNTDGRVWELSPEGGIVWEEQK